MGFHNFLLNRVFRFRFEFPPLVIIEDMYRYFLNLVFKGFFIWFCVLDVCGLAMMAPDA